MAGINSDTKLMIFADGSDGATDFVDQSPLAHTISVLGSAQKDTAFKKFGTASFLSPDGSALNIPDHPSFNIFNDANSVYTIDFWFRDPPTGNRFIMYHGPIPTSTPRWKIEHNSATGIVFDLAPGGIVNSGTSFVGDTNWHHCVCYKEADVIAVYIDGVQKGFGNTSGDPTFTIDTSGNDLRVGGEDVVTSPARSYGKNLDEIRIQNSNYFNLNPDSGLNDTYTVPTEQYESLLRPNPPANLTATAQSSSQIDLDWDEATVPSGGNPVTGYKIERESPIGGGFVTIVADTGSTAITYSDTGLDFDTQYNYRVSAINSDGTGDPSNEADATTDPTVPTAPQNLTAISSIAHEIFLDWDAPSSDGGSAITGYKIERESPIGGGFSVIVADTGTTDTTYTDENLDCNVVYNYRVSAINSVGTSPASNEDDSNANGTDSSTSLLLNFDEEDGSTNFIDSSPNNYTVNVNGNSVISDIVTLDEFGNSYFVDGTNGTNLTVADQSDFPGNVTDWTIDFYINFKNKTSKNYILWFASGGSNFLQIQYENDGSPSENINVNKNGAKLRSVNVSFNNNEWHHIALVKNGSNGILFIDGVGTGFSSFTTDTYTDGIRIMGSSTDSFNGYSAYFRMSDIARWTSNFTPPTEAFGCIEGTSVPVGGIKFVEFDGVHRNIHDLQNKIDFDLFTGEVFANIKDE